MGLSMAAGAIIGGLISAIGGAASSGIQAGNSKYAVNAQRQENALNRQWNLNLAKMSNQWNIDQWNRENAESLRRWNMENEYNSPTAQMERYRQAGLNPDLMYSNGNSGNAGMLSTAQSPTLSSGAPSSPADLSALQGMPNYGNVFTEAIQGALAAAQIKNINADTNKKNAEAGVQRLTAESISIDNLTRAAKNNQELEVGNTVIKLNRSIAGMNDAQKELLAGQLDKVTQEYVNLQQSLLNLQTERENVQISTLLNQKRYQNEVRELEKRLLAIDASTGLNRVNANRVASLLVGEIAGQRADVKLKEQQVASEVLKALGVSIDNESKQLHLDLDREYSRNLKSIGVIGDIVKVATTVLNGR